jgi:zinc transport system permease protein
MLEMLLKYDWMRNAFYGGIMIGWIAPMIGAFLVVRRLSLVADALSHVTLSGVAAGLFLQKEFVLLQALNPLYPGMIFSLIGSLFVEQFRRLYQSYQELAIPILLSGGMGLGVVLISAANGFNVDIAGYLFGSILTVGREDLFAIAFVALLVLLFLVVFYKELFALSFDEENAVLTGVPHRWLNVCFMIMVALVISVSIRVVGVLLVSALMTLPVATSLQFTNSFRQMLLCSVLFSQVTVLCGLFAAYYLDWASGGTIVLVSVLLLLIVLLVKRIRHRWLKQKIAKRHVPG